MKYRVFADRIEIFGKEDFCPQHTFECGQIFSYQKVEKDGKTIWEVFSMDKCASVEETKDGFVIFTKNPQYFENFFDLQTDYQAVKNKLAQFEILQKPIKFGYGIRILHQNLFETLISFIVSANNNIKRIQLILGRIREKYGSKMSGFYAFPTKNQLLQATEEDFAKLGAGYRAGYLFRVLRQIDEKGLQEWDALPTSQLRSKLTTLCGVGPKVADCILLFGYGRGDVFPVDTWIEKMFWKFYGDSVKLQNGCLIDAAGCHEMSCVKTGAKSDVNGEKQTAKSEKQNCVESENCLALKQVSREKIHQFLTSEFGLLSGYAQQYLFYYMRSGD